MRNTKIEKTPTPPYFVATSELGRPGVNSWVKTKATTVDGAKRLAARLPRRLTTTAKVAIQNSQGEFETIATLEDFSAITRSRPMWQSPRVTTGRLLHEVKMPNDIELANESIQDVADDVLERAKKYGFKPDEDMAREAVEESANLLNIALTEAQITEACKRVMNPREVSNCNELPAESQDNADGPKNALGHVAAKPFYIWANDDCANKSDSFSEAKTIRLALFNEGGESVYIVDADGVEVVDAEIECHESLAKSGYFAGARKPEVKPGFAGAFMVNDPLDHDGFAIVGDDVGVLILEAQAQLIHPDD